MSQLPLTVLPFVQGPKFPLGGTLSSTSLPEPSPQTIAIITPSSTKAPLSRLRMMRLSLASHRYPETRRADRTIAPTAPTRNIFMLLLSSVFPQGVSSRTPYTTRAGTMHDHASELRSIRIPRTRVNKGMKKGRAC
jgi:hypothetical protein